MDGRQHPSDPTRVSEELVRTIRENARAAWLEVLRAREPGYAWTLPNSADDDNPATPHP